MTMRDVRIWFLFGLAWMGLCAGIAAALFGAVPVLKVLASIVMVCAFVLGAVALWCAVKGVEQVALQQPKKDKV